jgi:hypothetical protein
MDEEDREALQRDAAAKMQDYQQALHAMTESGQRLFAGIWSDAAANAHQRLVDAYHKTKDEMEEALGRMHEEMLKAANIPPDHPAWKWARKGKS